MTKIFLKVITLFLSMSYSITAFAHAGHSHASVKNLTLHTVLTISIYLALMVVAFLVYKYLPKAIKQRVKK